MSSLRCCQPDSSIRPGDNTANASPEPKCHPRQASAEKRSWLQLFQKFLRLSSTICRYLESDPFAEKPIHALVQSCKLPFDEQRNPGIFKQPLRHRQLNLIVRLQNDDQLRSRFRQWFIVIAVPISLVPVHTLLLWKSAVAPNPIMVAPF